MKLTPPKGDMKVWTLLWAAMGFIGIYFGIVDSSPRTLAAAIIQIAGAVGIWIGFPSAKWLLIAFFCIGILGRASILIFHQFNQVLLPSLLFLTFCAVRFILWKPSNAPISEA